MRTTKELGLLKELERIFEEVNYTPGQQMWWLMKTFKIKNKGQLTETMLTEAITLAQKLQEQKTTTDDQRSKLIRLLFVAMKNRFGMFADDVRVWVRENFDTRISEMTSDGMRKIINLLSLFSNQELINTFTVSRLAHSNLKLRVTTPAGDFWLVSDRCRSFKSDLPVFDCREWLTVCRQKPAAEPKEYLKNILKVKKEFKGKVCG